MGKKKQSKIEQDVWKGYNTTTIHTIVHQKLFQKLNKYAEDKANFYSAKFDTPEYIHFYQIVQTYHRKNVFSSIKDDIKSNCTNIMYDIVEKVMNEVKDSIQKITSIDHNIQITDALASDIAKHYYSIHLPKAIKMFERSSYYKKLII